MRKTVNVGGVLIGGNNPVSIQSMTNVDSHDLKALTEQIYKLEDAGCEIIRIAAPDMDAVKVVGQVKKKVHIPVVADIHFDYRLAIASIEAGVDKVRINPGNIG
ncbi:MAG: flavodoxin-dependent (E)-4-hydroxy-3-methylbut-2-enyl-diphosphate synthase, partial [Clostridia bacterium]|nr:flavodoxin-dependent (E)-4-hydroxy-3-methylbut-2-enyl-diphosphate synthase [Clostridia bacterium]